MPRIIHKTPTKKLTVKPIADPEDDVLDTSSHDIVEIKPVEPQKPHIPPKPEMSFEAAEYEKLHSTALLEQCYPITGTRACYGNNHQR